MSHAPWLEASRQLHDEASWRLPDWEEYSESGHSASATSGAAWTDDGTSDDSDAVAETQWRVPPLPPMASTTTLTRRSPLRDLRALHLKFAHERQQAAAAAAATASATDGDPKATAELLATQGQIATQLEHVREELRAFQHEWQATAREHEEDRQREKESSLVVAPSTTTTTTTGTTLRFDMAVQTDVAAVHDDALQQWLGLITQKMEVLTTSFHGDTTQLPLRYPLQTQLDRPVNFATSASDRDVSVASWHVGGSLKTLVGETMAEQLLDLERAVACLATATRQTTTRYVEYFEKIVVQIQDLHQQRLRQVVEESLQEMKTQRTRYKKRVEQLEAECRVAKDEVVVWQQRAMTTHGVNATDKIAPEGMASVRTQQWEQERSELLMAMEQIQHEQEKHEASRADAESRARELQTQLAQMTALLEDAQRQSDDKTVTVRNLEEQLYDLKQQHRVEIERRDRLQAELRAEIRDQQQAAEEYQSEMATRHAHEMKDTLAAATAAQEREMERLKREHSIRMEEAEQAWRAKLEELEETKRRAPVTVSVDQHVQTDHELLDEGPTDERIARLKKRCKALESLLDKKFEDSSAASVASMDSAVSGRWSSRSESQTTGAGDGDMASRTLPLTLSFEGSFDRSYTSTHPANTPSRDGFKTPLRDVWETASHHSSSSMGRPTSLDPALVASSDPDAPSAEAMLALVRKLEALATSTKLSASTSTVAQPDEEPDLSAATTPTRQRPITSRPSSASLTKPRGTSNRSPGLAGSYSAALHSLKDPRRQQQLPLSGKSGSTAKAAQAAPALAGSESKKPRQPQRTQSSRFTSR